MRKTALFTQLLRSGYNYIELALLVYVYIRHALSGDKVPTYLLPMA